MVSRSPPAGWCRWTKETILSRGNALKCPTEAPHSLSLLLRVTKLGKGQEDPPPIPLRWPGGGAQEEGNTPSRQGLEELHPQHTPRGGRGHLETLLRSSWPPAPCHEDKSLINK
uniref:Uncharacterized protein n=1 Tax=Micrurus lemniscatus lemniscatus TaxID=129467 RepID=A0A2D4JBE2_MICLE